MTEPESRCGLCRRLTPVCRSHVIPAYLYDRVKSGSGKVLKGMIAKDGGGGSFDARQQGFTHPLLGRCCEELLQREYEGPVRLPLFALIERRSAAGLNLEQARSSDGFEIAKLSCLDYRRWKLFFLSILARANALPRGVAEFADVELGTKHGPGIRRMVLEGDPGPPSLYPVFLYLTLERFDGINHPYDARFHGRRCYSMLLQTVVATVVVSRNQLNERLTEQPLQEDGTAIAPIIPIESLPEFQAARRAAGAIPVKNRWFK